MSLIVELKKRSREHEAALWDRVASDLAKPARKRRIVNLNRINRFTKENEIVIVPGKVLGTGDLDHKVTIAAFQFSNGAKEKIEETGSKVASLLSLSKEKPQGKHIRIIG